MANPEHLRIFKSGVGVWNEWRDNNPDIKPDLSAAKLDHGSFNGANLSEALCNKASFVATQLSGANLFRANLSMAHLAGTDFAKATLNEADLSGSSPYWADFSGASLYKANLSSANLLDTNFSKANLVETNFDVAVIGRATFGDTDLSRCKGLETITHYYPSTIGIDTLYLSEGNIPESFLLGCGVPQQFIDYLPSLIGAIEPFQYDSCFISYSTKDEEFANRLHSRLRDAKVRVWYSPEDNKGGEKLWNQIERAIQVHDRLLLVLSENSIQSGWVESEIRKALEVEKRDNRRKLFPIRLADFDTIKQWKCFDADTGRDLAVEVREYFIPDFSNWKDHDSFEKGFDRLLRDLKNTAEVQQRGL